MVFAEAPEAFWHATSRLINSSNPDDRDTAVTALRDIDDVGKFDLIRPLLDDQYFYIQAEAIEQLKDHFRTEVLDRLRALSTHENLHYSIWAKDMLKELGEN